MRFLLEEAEPLHFVLPVHCFADKVKAADINNCKAGQSGKPCMIFGGGSALVYHNYRQNDYEADKRKKACENPAFDGPLVGTVFKPMVKNQHQA